MFWPSQLEHLLQINNADFFTKLQAMAAQYQDSTALFDPSAFLKDFIEISKVQLQQTQYASVQYPFSPGTLREGEIIKLESSSFAPFLKIALEALDLLSIWLDEQIMLKEQPSLRQFCCAWLECCEQVYLKFINTAEYQKEFSGLVNKISTNSPSCSGKH
ncbi:hypothetical protein BH10PSE19_BH10PSE19_06150 [soil metagenome]